MPVVPAIQFEMVRIADHTIIHIQIIGQILCTLRVCHRPQPAITLIQIHQKITQSLFHHRPAVRLTLLIKQFIRMNEVRKAADIVDHTDLFISILPARYITGRRAGNFKGSVLAPGIIGNICTVRCCSVKQGRKDPDFRKSRPYSLESFGTKDIRRRHIRTERIGWINIPDIPSQLLKGLNHILLTFPGNITEVPLIIADWRQRLMIVSMQAKLSAHIQQFPAIADKIIAVTPARGRRKRAFHLIAIRFDDQSGVFQSEGLRTLAHKRPPAFTIKILRSQVHLIINLRVGSGTGEGKSSIKNSFVPKTG